MKDYESKISCVRYNVDCIARAADIMHEAQRELSSAIKTQYDREAQLLHTINKCNRSIKDLAQALIFHVMDDATHGDR